MLKIVKEEQTILVENRKLFCDLCNCSIENTTFVRVSVPYTHKGHQRHFEDQFVDICSSKCFNENMKGLDFLLNSKLIPETNSLAKQLNKKYDEGEKCEAKFI